MTFPCVCASPAQFLSLREENMPYAARIEPHSPHNLKKHFRIASAFLADRGCLGPNGRVSGMLNVEFEEWWVIRLVGVSGAGEQQQVQEEG